VDKEILPKFWNSSAPGSGYRNFLKVSSTLQDRISGKTQDMDSGSDSPWWRTVLMSALVCLKYYIFFLKAELNLENKWKSDDLFYIIMNEIHPRFNQFCVF